MKPSLADKARALQGDQDNPITQDQLDLALEYVERRITSKAVADTLDIPQGRVRYEIGRILIQACRQDLLRRAS